MHKGTLIQTTENSVMLHHDDGTPDCDYTVSKKAVITLNNEPTTLASLKAGDKLVLAGKPDVLSVKAFREKKAAPPVMEAPPEAIPAASPTAVEETPGEDSPEKEHHAKKHHKKH